MLFLNRPLINVMEKAINPLSAKMFYEELYSGRIKPSVSIGGISRLVRLGYREDILCKLWDFPWDLAYPCGCPLKYLSISPEAKILDLGSGVGLNGFYLGALHLDKSFVVINIDIAFSSLVQSKQWIETTESLHDAEAKFFWICANASSIPFRLKTFDVVMMNGVFNICTEKEKLLGEVARVLKPGGILLISDLFAYKELPHEISSEQSSWVWCIGGAITEEELNSIAREAGFVSLTFHEQDPIDNLFYRATCSLQLDV
ncbi:MAG: methyltransferase domain-containing protein [Thermodesulforhabdaceae bacterium]